MDRRRCFRLANFGNRYENTAPASVIANIYRDRERRFDDDVVVVESGLTKKSATRLSVVLGKATRQYSRRGRFVFTSRTS